MKKMIFIVLVLGLSVTQAHSWSVGESNEDYQKRVHKLSEFVLHEDLFCNSGDVANFCGIDYLKNYAMLIYYLPNRTMLNGPVLEPKDIPGLEHTVPSKPLTRQERADMIWTLALSDAGLKERGASSECRAAVERLSITWSEFYRRNKQFHSTHTKPWMAKVWAQTLETIEKYRPKSERDPSVEAQTPPLDQ